MAAASRDSGSRASARPAACMAAPRRAASPEAIASRELATALEIAIAVEVTLHALGDLTARGTRRRVARQRRATDLVELGRHGLLGAARPGRTIDAGERALDHARTTLVKRLTGEDLEE